MILFFNKNIMSNKKNESSDENINLSESHDFQKEVHDASMILKNIIDEVHKKVVWQDELIMGLLIGLVTKGHVLLEWLPWLAKTLTIDTLAKVLDVWFSRIQFTPDLLPSDLIGTEVYNMHTGEFSVKKWPLFNNFILADEINRAPSKVQSALLEAMSEKSVTIWKESFTLDEPFIVLATQNPVEHSGTYKLPEAQMDRFLLKINVWYPTPEQEIEMYQRKNSHHHEKIHKIVNKKDIAKLQQVVSQIYVSENIFSYVFRIIDATRNTWKYHLDSLKNYISYGVSPRGWLAMIQAAKVIALWEWRTFVLPEDIKKVAFNTLNHRITLSYEAVASDITPHFIIQTILDTLSII